MRRRSLRCLQCAPLVERRCLQQRQPQTAKSDASTATVSRTHSRVHGAACSLHSAAARACGLRSLCWCVRSVDANAGLLSNFELFDFLSDPKRNKSTHMHTHMHAHTHACTHSDCECKCLRALQPQTRRIGCARLLNLPVVPVAVFLWSRSYPSYESYLERVSLQRTREAAVSYLDAKEAKKYEAEAAEEMLMAAADSASGSDDASLSPEAKAAAAALAKHTPLHRDYKPLENTCWLKARVLSYLSGTPAASQSAECVGRFIRDAQQLLQGNAAKSASIAAAAAGMSASASAAAATAASSDVRLTTCELIQLVNLRPNSLVEIHRAVEECEERLSEEDTLALLALIQRTLPPPPNARAVKQQPEEEGEGGAEAEAEAEATHAGEQAAGVAAMEVDNAQQ